MRRIEVITLFNANCLAMSNNSLTHYTYLLTIKTFSDDICVDARWGYTACPAFVRGGPLCYLYPTRQIKNKK